MSILTLTLTLPPPFLENMFAEIDIDGNGFIDAEELETGDLSP